MLKDSTENIKSQAVQAQKQAQNLEDADSLLQDNNSLKHLSNSLGRHKSMVPILQQEFHFLQRSKSSNHEGKSQQSQKAVPFSSNSDLLEIQLNIYKDPLADNHRNYEQIQKKSMISQSKLSRGLSIIDDNRQFLESVEFSSFERWTLLTISAICNAIVPCWMTVDIQCEGITRSAWRIFTLSILLLPFVIHEQKNTKKAEQQLSNLLKRQYLQKMYIGSINYCVWVLFGVLATKITSRAHSFCFLRLKFLVVTIKKVYLSQQCHEGQIGGSLLAGIGLIMMIWDSFSLPTEAVPNIYYLQCSWWERLLGDLLAIIGCLVLIYLQSRYSLPKGPRFTNLFIYNACISVNLVTFGYFFGGNQFTFDPKFGVYGLFTSQNFVGVFYVSIMLGINLIIANVLVNQIFSEFIRNVAACFEIVITISVYHIFEIQKISSGLTSLGLCFLVPGMMMIAGGQGTLEKLQIKINSQIYQTELRSTLKRSNALIFRQISKIDRQSLPGKQLSPVFEEQSKQDNESRSVRLKQKKE